MRMGAESGPGVQNSARHEAAITPQAAKPLPPSLLLPKQDLYAAAARYLAIQSNERPGEKRTASMCI